MPFTEWTIGAAVQRVLTVDPNRKVITIGNKSNVNLLYMGFDRGVTATNGFLITPYNNVTLQRVEGDDTSRPVYLIANAANTQVSVYEA